jgi:hypothetical protein
VTAPLVNHQPGVPAFAYRFDTADRSIVFSSETTPCENFDGKVIAGRDLMEL